MIHWSHVAGNRTKLITPKNGFNDPRLELYTCPSDLFIIALN